MARVDGRSAAGHALDLFLAAYGAVAGDMALSVLPRGGIYLAGGIAPAVLPELLHGDGPFLKAFHAKAEHGALMPQFPIWVVTDTAVGLRGAALMADA
jgi:glucokinase